MSLRKKTKKGIMVLLGMLEKNLPFLTLDTQKFNKLFEMLKKQKTKISKVQDIQQEKLTRNAIKCTNSKHITLKNCSKIQKAHNFVCATCLTETYFFTQILKKF